MSIAEILILILVLCVATGFALIARRLASIGGADPMQEERDRRAQEASEALVRTQAELTGRLSQLAESQAAAQARMADQLQLQERALSTKLEERLADVSRRVGESLQKSSETSQTSLNELKERLVVIDKAQENINSLSQQIVGLESILSNKQARGAIGEVQLRDIVTQALPPSAYAFQARLRNGRQADCLLTLPNPPGAIAIDSKFPLEAYHALREAKSEEERVRAARVFAADIAKHVKDIAEKYIIPGETAESALMFLPSEAVYAELHANHPATVQHAYNHRVWIVSPTTLMATLNTVRAVLKDARMREQAHIIQAEVGKLLLDVKRLDDRVEKLSTHFGQAEKDIRDIRISSDKITKRGDKVVELEMEEVEKLPAPPSAAE